MHTQLLEHQSLEDSDSWLYHLLQVSTLLSTPPRATSTCTALGEAVGVPSTRIGPATLVTGVCVCVWSGWVGVSDSLPPL